MSNATNNAAKLRAWVDPTAYGADATGSAPADAAFATAFATGLPLQLPPGTFRFSNPLTKTLLASQDFILHGAGVESTRLVFTSGGLTVAYNGGGRGYGDAITIDIQGVAFETLGTGTGDGLRIVNTRQDIVNDTEATVHVDRVSFSGTAAPNYWANALYLENITFPSLNRIRVEDGAKRTVGIYVNSVGTYAAVDTTITDCRMWEVLTGIKIRGRSEGVYTSQVVIVGCTTGVDWVATVATGKKPLLLLDSCHINTTGTAVFAQDVAQIIATSSLIYVNNSATVPSYGFDFQASNALSSESHSISAVTLIGIGSRTGSLAVGVRCGANVLGVNIDAVMDNIGTCVISEETNRTQIAPSARLTNYNTRSVGFYSVAGVAGGNTGGVSVDGSLQMEVNGGDTYQRDMYREQLRVGSLTYTPAAASETAVVPLARPFRTDTAMLVGCFGAYEGPSPTLTPDLPASTATELRFELRGVTPGVQYRINYIAYGY